MIEHAVRLAARKVLGAVLLGVILGLSCGPLAAAGTIANVYGRKATSLNGKWNYIVDPFEMGYYNYRMKPHDRLAKPTEGYFLDQHPKDKTDFQEYDFDKSPTLWVPGDWNSQDDKLFYYEGTVWYRRLFDGAPAAGKRLFIHFGAANYEAIVYLNGRKLGRHAGGFTPFAFEATYLVRPGSNSLVVKVDNKRHAEDVPTVNYDWWNYGGITRDVQLIEVPASFVSDYSLRLGPAGKGGGETIAGFVQLDGAAADGKVKVGMPELGLAAEFPVDGNGRAEVVLNVGKGKLRRWSPDDPRLYDVVISGGGDKVSERIGFRTIATLGGDILLNGKPVFLRGICMHEENPMRGGRAYSAEDARLLLGWAKDLGCNFVRLAHYPHNEFTARLADEMGLMLWEEIPVYWTVKWDDAGTFENARGQLAEVIARDANRASVVIWSIGNETPVGPARNDFMGRLAGTAKSLDPTRLVSAALEYGDGGSDTGMVLDDPLAERLDIYSLNEYIGWYNGYPEKCDRMSWTFKFDKPVIVSEFGGDALQGFHGDVLTRWSEEYQEDLFRRQLAMISKYPQVKGMTAWVLCDYRSPRRLLPGIQDGWNRKGLISENGTRKKAYYVLRDFYAGLLKPAKAKAEGGN